MEVLDPAFYLTQGLYSRVHSTRIDIAIDEMYNESGRNFDLKKLQEKKVQGLIYSSLTSYKEMKTMKGEQEHGATLTFGTRGNDRVFIRLYEKRFELVNKLKLSVEDVLEEYRIYNRYELELGKEVNPHVFERYLNGECLVDIAIDILLSKLEVYEDIETDTGIQRQAFNEWYDIFAH
jgi:phage replication initiation protein